MWNCDYKNGYSCIIQKSLWSQSDKNRNHFKEKEVRISGNVTMSKTLILCMTMHQYLYTFIINKNKF